MAECQWDYITSKEVVSQTTRQPNALVAEQQTRRSQEPVPRGVWVQVPPGAT